jgi:hypothetical protein
MTKKRHDFTIEQGATFHKTVTYLAAGVPVDLTGYTATLIAKHTPSSVTKDLNLSIGSGLSIPAPLTGAVEIDLTAAQTALLDFKKSSYELLIINGAYKKRLLQGKVYLSYGVS